MEQGSETRQLEAAIYSLTAHASQLLDLPVLDALFQGPQGRLHVLHNIRGEIFLDGSRTQETPKKRLHRKRNSNTACFDGPFFPESAYKHAGETYTTKVPKLPPPWLLQLLQVLKENAHADEIFRRPGNAKRLKELMVALNKGETMDFRKRLVSGNCSIHDLVSLLKGYINHFEDPLIPHYQNGAFCQTTGIKNTNQRTEALQILTLLCPCTNRLILQRLFECLQAVYLQADENRMTLANLAVCIAPSIIRQSRLHQQRISVEEQIKQTEQEKCVVQFMMEHGATVFQKPPWLCLEMQKMEQELQEAEEEKENPATPANVACFVQPDGRIVSDVPQVEYMKAVKTHTELELAKLYDTIKRETENFTGKTPDDSAKGGRKKQQRLKKFKRKMEDLRLPGTPAAHVPHTARLKKTPLSILNGIGSLVGSRAFGLMTPKGSTGSVHLVTPDNSHPRLARDFPTVADLEDLMPADDSESEPPVWKGFLDAAPGRHRETFV